MTNNNIGRKSSYDSGPHHRAILLMAAGLLMVPSLVCGQTESAKLVGKDEANGNSSTSLADAYHRLALVIERESKELEQLKLDGTARERMLKNRQNAELAEKIDAGLVELQKIREERIRLLETVRESEIADSRASDRLDLSNSTPASVPAAGLSSVPTTESLPQNLAAASVIQTNSLRQTTDIASRQQLSIPAASQIQARFRLPCGCLGEIHVHGTLYRLKHQHRTGKMTTQTLPEFSGAIPGSWVPVVALADGNTIVFRDSRSGRYLVHRN